MNIFNVIQQTGYVYLRLMYIFARMYRNFLLVHMKVDQKARKKK